MDKFNLSWDSFQGSTLASIKELLTDEDFVDVTLASDDGKQLKAHKVILSACSPFLKNILLQNPHPHPLIYLNNISWVNLKKILEFMYLGKVEVEEQDLQLFMKDANRLRIKGLELCAEQFIEPKTLISTEPEFGTSYVGTSTEGDYQNMQNINTKEEEKYQQSYNTTKIQILDDLSNFEIWDTDLLHDNTADTVVKYEAYNKNSQNQLYYCAKCAYKSNKQYNVKKHTMAIHDGIRYPCSHCDYKATETGHLKKHIKKYHS